MVTKQVKQWQGCTFLAIRRFTRLTNAFSKKPDNLKAAVALHFAYYNFCRVHKSLRVTPAIKSSIASMLPFSGVILVVIVFLLLGCLGFTSVENF